MVGVGDYLEVTVESNEHLDFSDFDFRLHSGVFLDGVGDTGFLKKNWEDLKERPKLAKGAQSATMDFSSFRMLTVHFVVS